MANDSNSLPAKRSISKNVKAAIGLLLLGVVLLFAYWKHFSNPFLFDDIHSIVQNEALTSLKNIPRIFQDKTLTSILPPNQVYRPIVISSYALDYYFGGGFYSEVFHRSMFAVFLLQNLFLFLLLRKLFTEMESRLAVKGIDPEIAALLATAVYALNTVNAETLNYISARSDVYSTFFVVLSLWFTCVLGGRFGMFGAFATAFMAFITKESTIVLPALTVLSVLLFQTGFLTRDLVKKKAAFKKTEPQSEAMNRADLNRALVQAIPPAIGTGLALALYIYNQGSAPQPGNTAFVYAVTQLWVITRYIGAFIFPTHLSADYDQFAIENIYDLRVQFGFTLILLLLLIAARCLRTRALVPISFGIFWFFCGLAVTSSVIPIDDMMNDHRMYFPFVGLGIACSWFFYLLWKEAQKQQSFISLAILTSIGLIYVAGHVIGIRERSKVWSSEESLWLDVTEKSPGNPRGLMNYGVSQLAAGKYERAEIYFLRALAIWPTYSTLHINLGVTAGALKRNKEAERHFLDAIRFQSGNPYCHYFYAQWLNDQSRLPEARRELDLALKISPRYRVALELKAAMDAPKDLPNIQEAQKNLAESLAAYQKGDFESSLSHAGKVIMLDPKNARGFNNIGAALIALKRPSEAIGPLKEAIRLDPYLEIAWNNLRSIDPKTPPMPNNPTLVGAGGEKSDPKN